MMFYKCSFCSYSYTIEDVTAISDDRYVCRACSARGYGGISLKSSEVGSICETCSKYHLECECKKEDEKMNKHEFVTALYCLQKSMEEAMEEFQNGNEILGYFSLGSLKSDINNYIKKFEFEDGPGDVPY